MPDSATDHCLKVHPGFSMQVHTVKGRYANSFIVEEDNRLFVTDVHLGGEKYVLGYLKEVMNRDHEEIELVICTHDHPDHIGGVLALARECDARIGLPLASNSNLRKFRNCPTGHLHMQRTTFVEFFRPRMWNMYFKPESRSATKPTSSANIPSKLSDRRVKPNHRLKDYASIPGFPNWQVVHTPGHSWDSCCYFHRPTRSLVTGDTLLGSHKKNKLVLPAILSNPRQLRASITKLRQLDPLHVYPGHGRSFSGPGLLRGI